LRTIDLLSFQVRELEQSRLNLERMRALRKSAGFSLIWKGSGRRGHGFVELYEDEGAAISRLAAAARQLEDLRRYDSAIEPQLEPLAAARATLEDLAVFLRDYVANLEANPQRLEEIEDRLAFSTA